MQVKRGFHPTSDVNNIDVINVEMKIKKKRKKRKKRGENKKKRL